eukprot:3743-Pyramimonas_sp.AAC.1
MQGARQCGRSCLGEGPSSQESPSCAWISRASASCAEPGELAAWHELLGPDGRDPLRSRRLGRRQRA